MIYKSFIMIHNQTLMWTPIKTYDFWSILNHSLKCYVFFMCYYVVSVFYLRWKNTSPDLKDKNTPEEIIKRFLIIIKYTFIFHRTLLKTILSYVCVFFFFAFKTKWK